MIGFGVTGNSPVRGEGTNWERPGVIPIGVSDPSTLLSRHNAFAVGVRFVYVMFRNMKEFAMFIDKVDFVAIMNEARTYKGGQALETWSFSMEGRTLRSGTWTTCEDGNSPNGVTTVVLPVGAARVAGARKARSAKEA